MPFSYSVVIPAHNTEAYVAEAVSSALSQTCPPKEVIVVDDGSTDATAHVAAHAGAVVLRNDVSVGPSASRNSGAVRASSELIAFLDADDYWRPQHAEQLIGQMLASDSVFAGSRAELFGKAQGETASILSRDRTLPLCDALIIENPIVQSSVVVQRREFLAVGGFDESMRLAEDYDLWTRLAPRGQFVFVDAATIRRRIHSGQISLRRNAELVQSAWGVRRRGVSARLKDAEPDERDRVLSLVERAARADLLWAVWTGSGAMLRLVAQELALVDELLSTGVRFSGMAGANHWRRRQLQRLSTWTRGIAWRLFPPARRPLTEY